MNLREFKFYFFHWELKGKVREWTLTSCNRCSSCRKAPLTFLTGILTPNLKQWGEARTHRQSHSASMAILHWDHLSRQSGGQRHFLQTENGLDAIDHCCSHINIQLPTIYHWCMEWRKWMSLSASFIQRTSRLFVACLMPSQEYQQIPVFENDLFWILPHFSLHFSFLCI